MIMLGVLIGENCVIGGSSVVARSVPDGVMVAGNPARFIGYTEAFYNRIKDNEAMCVVKELVKTRRKYIFLSLSNELFTQKGKVELPEE